MSVPNPADLYIAELRASRDQLEITVASLRHKLAVAEAKVAEWEETARDAKTTVELHEFDGRDHEDRRV